MSASKNRLQKLYNAFEREFASGEELFLKADKHRLDTGAALSEILAILTLAKEKLGRYPQAGVLKRISLIETLIKDLELRYAAERRHFNALGFLLSRLRNNLAVEMLEPKLYNKIRSALEKEETLKQLREKYPDAEAVVTERKHVAPARPEKKIRLMLIATAGLHYAIPVTRIVKKAPAAGPLAEKLSASGYERSPLPGSRPLPETYAHAIAYTDIKGQRRIVFCDEYFQPVEVGQRLLKKLVHYLPSGTAGQVQHRPLVRFYGRQFFVYGARLSYTVRTGGRDSAER